MSNSNQPAHPTTVHKVKGDNIETVSFTGLTKREHVAALTLQGLLANRHDLLGTISSNTAKMYAQKSVQLADYLLNELNNTNPQKP